MLIRQRMVASLNQNEQRARQKMYVTQQCEGRYMAVRCVRVC